MKTDRTPAELAALGLCPRARDGGVGPRQCGRLDCRANLRTPGTRGPVSRRRLRVVDDECGEDVFALARAAGGLSIGSIAELLGCSKKAVSDSLMGALVKYRRGFEKP